MSVYSQTSDITRYKEQNLNRVMEIQNYRLNTDMTYAAFSLIRGLDTSHVLKGYLMFVKGGIMTIKFNMLI
jgi:hypothetical protein